MSETFPGAGVAMRWTRTIGLWLVAVWAVLTATFMYLTLSEAFEKDYSVFAQVLVVIVNVAALAVALALAEDVLVPGRRFRGLLRPRPIAGLYAASFSAAGVVATVLSLLDPGPASTKDVANARDYLAEKIDTVRRQTAPAPARPSTIRQRIGKVFWGRENCSITFSIALADQALVVSAVKKPPSETDPYRLDARIVAEHDKVIETVGRGPHRGAAGAFIYETDGVTEQLTWRDELMGPDPTVLDACGEIRS